MYILNGRKVEVTDKEFEVGHGVSVLQANYADTGLELTEDELLEFEDANQEELYEDAYSSAASDAYDMAKDRD